MLTLEELAGLHARYAKAAKARVAEFSLGNRQFEFNRHPFVMGVINLSPDSWYRESVCLSTEQAVRRGRVLAAQGAAIIDIGAESTLAQASRADASAQLSRALPVLNALRQDDVLVSIETYDPQVARSVLEAGANIINLTGADPDGEICRMAADHDAAVILCYVQGQHVRAVNEFNFAHDMVGAMSDYFSAALEAATAAGQKKIFLDPGLGFYYRNLQDSAQRVRFQMQTFLESFRLRALGFPLCQALPHAFEYFGEEVRSAEAFFAVLAALGKTDVFRTHEVPRVRAVLETLRVYESAAAS